MNSGKNKTVQNKRNINVNTVVVAHILSVDSKQGDVRKQTKTNNNTCEQATQTHKRMQYKIQQKT